MGIHITQHVGKLLLYNMLVNLQQRQSLLVAAWYVSLAVCASFCIIV
jgi:hypothetical protein